MIELTMIDSVDDTFLYFAYGSNMLTRRLRAPARTPSAKVVGTGFVKGHRLTFDKVSSDGSGKCDMEATSIPTDRVYGVLFSINRAEKGALDDAEGLNKGYREGKVQVLIADGTTSTAEAYIATKKEPTCRPYDWYKALVIAGAVEHSLPNAYIEWLRTFRSQPDPKADRRAENEALLFDG